MPAIPSGSKVLVSGANGYIAMWVVQTLLERGYSVRGTVRSGSKGKFMTKYFTRLGYGGKFEFVVVEDIVKDGAFDEAVKGVHAIEHMASPFHGNVEEPEEFIVPAVQGTVGMLKSALKNGTNVKRIVITSSCASVMSPPAVPTKYSEEDWNEISPKQVEEQGSNASPMTIYLASKTLAERAAWKYYDEIKSQVKWDLSVILPSFVYGPPIHDLKSLSSLNTSMQMWYDIVLSGTPKTRDVLLQSNSWADVRDVALGHVLALEKEAAGGERIITNAGGYFWQEWVDAANSLKPNPLPTHKFQKGRPELLQNGKEKVIHITFEKSKEERILGIKFKTLLETTRDTMENFASRGW